MLDINLRTGDEVENIRELLTEMITHILKTPYESRIFNPGFGTGAYGALQEPIDYIVNLIAIRGLITAAIERNLPNITAKVAIEVLQDKGGTASLLIKTDVLHHSNTYQISIQSDSFRN